RVLEVGTGSGYSACVLSLLAAEVVSVERHQSLALRARETLASLAVTNVELRIGDGSRGVPERAPFEAIAVHAAAPSAPPALISQLADGGRLVVPIATEAADLLTLLRRCGEEIEIETIGPCRFVPLVGEEGF
ncbi:MAG TPA: protein-L-isoaspartate O-methyltransferase, partial [Solirubrobacterales bacterium]|nr:protein-L-isoaspartate O-methyltransferase [Solirubrobacterales bacterium]